MISSLTFLPGFAVLWIIAVGGLTAGVCHAQANRQLPSSEDRLRTALQSYLQGELVREFEPTSYVFACVNLAGNRKQQAIVYLTGRGWCGSGGCHMLVVTQEGSSWKVIARIPAVRLPIRVLETRSHGWRDLSVFQQGGGILRGYNERVRFDGESYSKESTNDAEERPARKMKGSIIISWKNREVPLYP